MLGMIIMINTITIEQAFELTQAKNIDDLTFIDQVYSRTKNQYIFKYNNQLYAFYSNHDYNDDEVITTDGSLTLLWDYDSKDKLVKVYPVKKITKQVARYIKED